MLTLLDDGSLTIDFGDGPPTPVRAPRFGAFKRLRLEVQRVQAAQTAKLAELREPVGRGKDAKPIEPAEQIERFQAFATDSTAAWWQLALAGDETFKGLAEGTVPDPDDWPVWMFESNAISEVILHWRSVPLARGGQPARLIGPTTTAS